MASKLAVLQARACQASRFVAKQASACYKDTLEKNKQYVVNPSTAQKCVELSNQLFYTRLASIPGRCKSFWKELDGVKQIWKNSDELRVEDHGITALFGIELYGIFVIGEMVGRGFTITGYHV